MLTLPLTLIAVLVVTSTLADPIKVIENSPAIGLHSDQEEGSVVYRDDEEEEQLNNVDLGGEDVTRHLAKRSPFIKLTKKLLKKKVLGKLLLKKSPTLLIKKKIAKKFGVVGVGGLGGLGAFSLKKSPKLLLKKKIAKKFGVGAVGVGGLGAFSLLQNQTSSTAAPSMWSAHPTSSTSSGWGNAPMSMQPSGMWA